MKTVGELIDALSAFDRNSPIHLEQRIKTGYVEGGIYESVSIDVAAFKGKVLLQSHGVRLTGGW